MKAVVLSTPNIFDWPDESSDQSGALMGQGPYTKQYFVCGAENRAWGPVRLLRELVFIALRGTGRLVSQFSSYYICQRWETSCSLKLANYGA